MAFFTHPTELWCMSDEEGSGSDAEGERSAPASADHDPGRFESDASPAEEGDTTDASEEGAVEIDPEAIRGDREAAVRAYYRALDAGEYDALKELLAPEFVHDRPDMRLQGRKRFLQFMREERPQRGTTHEISAVYEGSDDRSAEIAVRGRLIAASGTDLFGFVDVFRFREGRIENLETYTD